MFNEKKEGEQAGGWALSRLALGDSRPRSRRRNSTLLAAKKGPCASTHCPDPVCFCTSLLLTHHCTSPCCPRLPFSQHLTAVEPLFPTHSYLIPNPTRAPVPGYPSTHCPGLPLTCPHFIWKQGSCCSQYSADLQDICVSKRCLAAPLLAFFAGNLEKWVSVV